MNKLFLNICLFLVLILSGCAIKKVTFSGLRAEKGSGSVRIYNFPYDVVWDTIPNSMDVLGLSVAGANKEQGYLLAERIEKKFKFLSGFYADVKINKIVIFVEGIDDHQGTKVEVISRSSHEQRTHYEIAILQSIAQKLNLSRVSTFFNYRS
ncbi:MAG: hypothetical protein ACE5GK_11995 [Nitrospiria bacterium]